MSLIFATHNAHKLTEVRAILAPLGLEVRSLADLGFHEEPPEDAPTFAENALSKARFIQSRLGGAVLADDSGLAVNALGGRPGVHSKRYSLEATAEANNALLLHELTNHTDRSAAFITVLALVTSDYEGVVEGRCEGSILHAARGEGGFGYDPLFAPQDAPGRAMAELSLDEKNAISHRGRAFGALPALLKAAKLG